MPENMTIAYTLNIASLSTPISIHIRVDVQVLSSKQQSLLCILINHLLDPNAGQDFKKDV